MLRNSLEMGTNTWGVGYTAIQSYCGVKILTSRTQQCWSYRDFCLCGGASAVGLGIVGVAGHQLCGGNGIEPLVDSFLGLAGDRPWGCLMLACRRMLDTAVGGLQGGDQHAMEALLHRTWFV